MSLQQGDVLLFQTDNDGDIESVNGVVTMTCGFETMAYTSMFNGAGWWGDLEETDPDFQYPSETEEVLENMPAIPANLRLVEEAALRDLAVFKNQKIANTVEVEATMPGVDLVTIAIRIEAQGEISAFEFTENWSCEGVAQRLAAIDSETSIPAEPRVLAWSQFGTVPFSSIQVCGYNSNTENVYVSEDNPQGVHELDDPEGTFTEVVDAYPDPFGEDIEAMAVDKANGDVYILRESDYLRLPGGSGAWDAPVSLVGSIGFPISIAVDSTTKDVWVADEDPLSPGESILKQTGGVGPFVAVGSYGGASEIQGVTVNSANGDVYAYDGASSDKVYKLEGGTAPLVEVADFPGSNPKSIAVNSFNGNVLVGDGSTDEIHRLVGGEAPFELFTVAPGSPRSIAVNEASGWDEVFFADRSADQVFVYS